MRAMRYPTPATINPTCEIDYVRAIIPLACGASLSAGLSAQNTKRQNLKTVIRVLVPRTARLFVIIRGQRPVHPPHDAARLEIRRCIARTRPTQLSRDSSSRWILPWEPLNSVSSNDRSNGGAENGRTGIPCIEEMDRKDPSSPSEDIRARYDRRTDYIALYFSRHFPTRWMIHNSLDVSDPWWDN